MDMTAVKSSMISAIGYEADKGGTLRVTFLRGPQKTAEYYEVPASVYDDLLAADKGGSVGQTFNNLVRDKFQWNYVS